MAKNLVIVESPAKAKTITKMLGKNYKVVSSVGHIRDLPKSRMGVDIENDFEPEYINIRGKGDLIKSLKKEAKASEKIFIATDPDREGEAIAWHLAYLLDINPEDALRVEFNEITKETVKSAIQKPRGLNFNIFDAQQARRVLDRLVGYKISPLLWKKIKRGLSAGRVQSVAVKLVCDKEAEIDVFIPKEYWTLKALLDKDDNSFEANYYGIVQNNKEEKKEIQSKAEMDDLLKTLNNKTYSVSNVKKGQRKRNPYPPYTTSTLQQDASKKLGFPTKKTMMIAQQLYEGIDLKKGGTTGLITYMRTDSTRLSQEAILNAKEYIIKNYGKDFSTNGIAYGGKKKSQDAHEAIRPSYLNYPPESIKANLTKDQFKLYNLIWERFLGSQMKPALYDTMNVSIQCGDNIFRATGSILKFAGFLRVYKSFDEETADNALPDLRIGDLVKLLDLEPKQNFTQPPARYTEASLVKTLEELGIGRPSTYASTIGNILSKNYVTLEKKYLYPTELGVLVNDLLVEYFNQVINEEFTAILEEELDDIANGEKKWKTVVENFYKTFEKELSHAESDIDKIEIKDEVSEELCEKCGRNMVIKTGKFGKFLACPGYPECKNTKPILEKIGVDCPLCDGEVVKMRTKKGRIFFGCSNYPKCKYTSWDEPSNKKCSKCNSNTVIKRTKQKNSIICTNEHCNHSENF